MEIRNVEGHRYSYRIYLTRAELFALSDGNRDSEEEEKVFFNLFRLIDKEAKKLGNQQGETGS